MACCATVVQGLGMWCTCAPELQYWWARADGSKEFGATNQRTLNSRESGQLGCGQQDVLWSRSWLRQLSNIGSAGECSTRSPWIHTRQLVPDVLREDWCNRYSALNNKYVHTCTILTSIFANFHWLLIRARIVFHSFSFIYHKMVVFCTQEFCSSQVLVVWSTKPWHSSGKGSHPLLDICRRTEEEGPILITKTYRYLFNYFFI